MSDRKKIVFVIPSLCQGGAEVQLISLINGISADKFEKHLIFFEQEKSLLKRVNQQEVQVKHLPRRRKYDRTLSLRLAEYLKVHQIDIVHATLQISGYVAWKAIEKSARSIPLIIAIHSTKSRTFKEELTWRTIYQQSMRGADILTFVSDNQRNLWIAKFPWMKTSSITIHNGIDCERFIKQDHVAEGRKLLEAHGIDDTLPILSCIAVFRPEKNHNLLVEAIGRLNLPCTVLFAGDGAGRAAIEALVKQAGLQKTIFFLGRVSDVRPLLAVSTITILASSSEAFSMAMLESLAMQVPMLATNVGGMSEAIIPYETGLLVEHSDVAALASGLREILSDSERLSEMGRKGAALVREKFTRDTMIMKTEQMILECCERHCSQKGLSDN